jgi:short-subunit dehydrogenase
MLKSAAVVAVLAVTIFVVFYQLPKVTYKTYSSGAIVITGTSSGIGKHAAISLAKKGYTVFATVRKESDAKELNKLKIKTLKPIIMDVTKPEQVKV